MGVELLLFLALTIFKAESIPLKVFTINQRQTKEYEVFKDILIQNLIVTTDNLKLILNWEHENTMYRIEGVENSNTKLTNYNVIEKTFPFQYATSSRNVLQSEVNDEKVQNRMKSKQEIPGSHTSKGTPVSLKNFELSKYLTKRSQDEADKSTDNEIKDEIKEEEAEEENYADTKSESNEHSSVIENLLNNGDSNSLHLDNNSDTEEESGKAKRQAEGESPLPVPTGDGFRKMHTPPPQTECVVTGTLCLMLRMSQIVGVAPLSFRRTHAGWCIRVSKVANFYGKTLSFILWFFSTITIAIDILIEPERSYRTRTNSTRIVWVADVGTVGLVVCTAAFTGLMRMKWLTVYLLNLQEINLRLSLYREEPSTEGIRMLIVVSSMIFTCSTILLDFGIFIYQVVTYHGKVLTSCMYIFYNISSAVQQVILLTFFETATSVLTSLQTLNNCLRDILQEILNKSPEAKCSKHASECRVDMYTNVNNKSINSVVDTMSLYRGQQKPPPKSMPTTVRRLGLLYCSICDVLRQVNDSHGTVMVALLLCLLLHLVITPYHVITNIFNKSRSDRSSPLLQLNWVVLHFGNLLLIIEPCHRTHDEMELTRHLVSQMMRYTPLEDSELLLELQMFYQHLILNEVSYQPLKMFPLNRTLITTILGSITTYLVVIVQL